MRFEPGSLGGAVYSAVGEQDERVGDDDVGDERGQTVVVAEPDLVGREGIVFVDDRHRAQVEQAVERTAHVAVLLWGDRVGNGDEDLSDTQPVPCESGLVLGHQQALADGGARLLVGHVGRTLVETERAETGRDRAGGDQHHAAAHQSHAGDGRHKRVQPLRIQVAARLGQRAGAHLHHDGLRFGDGPAHLRLRWRVHSSSRYRYRLLKNPADMPSAHQRASLDGSIVPHPRRRRSRHVQKDWFRRDGRRPRKDRPSVLPCVRPSWLRARPDGRPSSRGTGDGVPC